MVKQPPVAVGEVTGYPQLRVSGQLDQNEVAALKQVIQASKELEGQTAHDFDLSRFADVYVNDFQVSLAKIHADFMARFRASHPNLVIGNGFLDYKLAYYGQWKQGVESYEQLEAKARAEGRKIKDDELKALLTNGSFMGGRHQGVGHKPILRFDEFKIDGDRAEVVSDDGGVLSRHLLLKTPDGWKIGGWRIIDAHG